MTKQEKAVVASERALKEIVVQAAIGVRSLMFSHFYECTCSFCTFNKAVDALLASRQAGKGRKK